jgi:adenine-specific DNA-methyltransferase
MKQLEAEKLLNETFNKEFSLERFGSFIRELFKGKCRLNLNNKSLMPYSQFSESISSFRQIGEYAHGRTNLVVLAVQLKRTDSIEKARTMQRNFVGTWLMKGDVNVAKDGALVAFYGENPDDWRFSFVKMDYKFDETGKAIKELTPAKRLSYLVGKHEPNHTCRKQFLNLLQEENNPPSFKEIEEAFGVENVTKEFFDKYKELYFELKKSLDKVIEENSNVKKDFELKQINSTEFTKKLLGQIVFLYFLQKKGWLGIKKEESGNFGEWGTGYRNFMTRLFNKEIVPYNNFFDEILEPLFYEALAKSRDGDYFSNFKCKIPFLNGGLFEPIKDYDWVHTKIELDNEIFRKIIIETFDKFNFTIKEDEPLEREVAVDPEMLGKVFENLLDVSDRKSKGAFYTPREIVHYMCQQSLINYLETNSGIKREDLEKFILKGDLALDYLRRFTDSRKNDVPEEFRIPISISKNDEKLDELLRNIKICDPAVGSGAFPVGMMNEIVKARQVLQYFLMKNNKKSDYELKRETIENCLYGVDI